MVAVADDAEPRKAAAAAVPAAAVPASASAPAAGGKMLLAIRCSCPGRPLQITKLCVNDRMRLRDVLAGWASSVMNAEAGLLPSGTRVTGAANKPIEQDTTLQALRAVLPVREGRLTVSVEWPFLQQAPAPDSARKAGKTNGAVPSPGNSARAKASGSAVPQAKKQATSKSKKEEKAAKDKAKDAKLAAHGKRLQGAEDKENLGNKAASPKKPRTSKAPKKDEKKKAKAEAKSSSSDSSDDSSDSESDNEPAAAIMRFIGSPLASP